MPAHLLPYPHHQIHAHCWDCIQVSRYMQIPAGTAVFANSHSATSRALTCPDIITEIVEQTSHPLDGTLGFQYDHRLLATLALVCHTFNGPATRALWSRLESFFPLMNILSTFDNKALDPDDIPTYVSCSRMPSTPHSITDNHAKMISGDIPPHEFARFRELGSFVRAVIPSPYGYESEIVAPATWPYLAQLCGGKPLFPSLRELHWIIQENFGTELSLVVSPSLQRLTVCYAGGNTDSRQWPLSQSMLFRTIFNITPHLTHFTIDNVDEALIPACLSNLSVLSMLRVVSLDQNEPVNLDALRKLSTVASLEELSMAVGEFEVGLPDFVGFPSLKRLEISILSGPALARPIFVVFRASQNLRELILKDDCDSYVTTKQISEASPLIAQHVPSVTDLTLSLSIEKARGTGPDVDISITTALAPLFALPLRKLSLEVADSSVPSLNDAFFNALARSCPELVELSVVFPDGYMEPSEYGSVFDDDAVSDNDAPPRGGITPRTLFALARSCPHLRVLHLPWMSVKGSQDSEPGDLSGDDSDPESQRECSTFKSPALQAQPHHHPLRTLVVDELMVADDEHPEYAYTACARLVHKVFPDLDTTAVPPDIMLTGEWKRVLDSVRSWRLARSGCASD